MATPLIVNFAADVYTGWGQVGMNWVGLLQPEFQPIFGSMPTPQHFVGMDPYRYTRIQQAMDATKAYKYSDKCIWVDPIGNDLESYSNVDPQCLIGRVIIEKADLKLAMQNLAKYDLLLTGSQHNQERIEAATGREVKLIHEGIDPSLFCPGAKSGWHDTFNIFASGKVEFRKAPDVTLMAFKRFVQKHPEARLITLWNSPYADLGNGYKGVADEPLWLNEHGQLDIPRWAHDNGIPDGTVFELGNIPNFALPQILREMDVMLAPSRFESCTSLPVKEAMACGVPVIYGRHSGMLDLEGHGNPLDNGTPIKASREYFFPLADWEWYEPDPQEIDFELEFAYEEREDAKAHARADSYWLRGYRTWQKHVDELKAWLPRL